MSECKEIEVLECLSVKGYKNGKASVNGFKFHNESGSFTASDSHTQQSRNYNKWSPVEEGVTLAWNDVYVYVQTNVKKKVVCKRIINGGAVKAGSLVALLGASGAGKSTLMSTLAHRNSGGVIVEGDILINGRPVGDFMRYLCGYMHQEDLFVGSLTVLEHMHIMARLKLDRGITTKEIRSKIHELLRNLGLMKCLNTRIGESGQSKSLSGGEKKRLAFATELLTDPPILFCDEPTTGLDSFSAIKLVKMMNNMALKGKTILCTIHQPSSDIFAMFNEIILLAEGRIAFMGTTENAVKFFDEMGCKCPKSYNPADFFVKTLAIRPGLEESSKQAIKMVCDRFAVSEYYKHVEVVVNYEIHMGKAFQQGIFLVDQNILVNKQVVLRCDEETFNTNFEDFAENNDGSNWISDRGFRAGSTFLNADCRYCQKKVLGLIIGLCYYGTERLTQNGVQSVMGTIFLLVSENTFNPMYSVLAHFPQDTPIFIREYKSGLYSPTVYYVSRILALIPGFIIDPIFFVLTAYWLCGLKSTAYAFFMTMAACILTMNVSASCGIFFSNAFDAVPTAMAYLVPFDYILMITSGLFVKLSSLPKLLYWTQYMSWLMYSTEIMSILQWEGERNITCEVPDRDIPCITDGSQVLDKYSFSEDNLVRDVSVMVALCCLFHILALICLSLRARRR